MNRYERRKLKANIYRHGNAIMYGIIFVIAGIITIAAALNRTDKIAYVDESKLASTQRESVAIKNSTTQKVAVSETDAQTTAKAVETMTEPEVTQETETQTEQVAGMRIRVTADTLKVRSEASTDAEILGMVDMDEMFDVISQNGSWIEINYNGTKGFISSEFTEIIG